MEARGDEGVEAVVIAVEVAAVEIDRRPPRSMRQSRHAVV